MQPIDLNRLPLPAAGSTEAAGPQELGQQDFLKMLIAQLENQDPLDPQDATEFTSQLAQFNSLDQLMAMRNSMDALTGVQNEAQSLATASLIGREALVSSAEFGVGDDPAAALPTLYVELDTPAELLGAEIRDVTGRVVARSDALGALPAGRTALEWSSFDRQPGPGVYTLNVTPAAGASSPATLVRGRVSGASLSGGAPVLLLDGAQIPLSSLVEIREHRTSNSQN